jgi:murein DD-endopeptidase MepM/ murein hydrolase activator NlpD
VAKLSVLEIYEVARQAGFDHDHAVTMTAIAMAESRGNTLAHATHGEDSRGLWQVNVNPSVRQNTFGDLFDPLTNARAAFQISHGGTNIQPWSTTHASNAGTPQDYRTYLAEARLAAANAGASNAAFEPPPVEPQQATGVDLDSPDVHVQPISDGKLTDTFGAARSGGRKHEGIDIFGERGTPIHAVASGEVVKGFHNDLGGTVVRIQGDDGRYYYYAHLDSVNDLQVGQHVKAGDVIGGMGNTGDASTTPVHLHFQVQENGVDLNPFDFLQGLPDTEDVTAGTVPLQTVPVADEFDIDPGAAAAAPDTDHDGLTDDFEKIFGTDLKQADSDHDGLSDAYETGTSHTNPLLADTDGDKLSDLAEITSGSDAGKVPIPDAARAAHFGGLATMDTDSDGLSDEYETKIGTDPLKADSDGDSLSDSFERAHGFDPRQIDSDHDGLTDQFEVASGQTTGPITGDPPLGSTPLGSTPLGGTPLGGDSPLGGVQPDGTDDLHDHTHVVDAGFDTH